MNWIDRFIAFLNPMAGVRRAAARASFRMLTRLGGGYEGAGTGRRQKNWRPTEGDAEKTVSGALKLLRNRSRDLSRNNPYAAKAVSTIVSNTIGYGIQAKVKNPRLMKEWKDWCESPNAHNLGQMNFYSMQRLVMRSIVEGGEILIRRVRKDSVSGMNVPISLQLLEGDYIDTARSDFSSANNVRDGIEYDKSGKIIAYYLFENHPGAPVLTIGSSYSSVRVPAEDIIHIFRMDRPGQVRGVPWVAPSIVRIRDLDEYEDAQLVRQKIAACFVGFIHDSETPTNSVSASADETKPISSHFEPGAWESLPPGKDIKFATPPSVGSDFDAYLRRTLIAISAGYGIPYEAMTGDLSNVNFSSGRMGWLEFQRQIEDWRWNMFVPGFLNKVWAWWYEQASIAGIKAEPEMPLWTAPRREMIDPTKETEAMISSIRGGLSTLSDTVRELGYDPQSHFEEMKADIDMLDRLGLVLDCDPRKVNKSGLSQAVDTVSPAQ
jgi:lambda family phage portal protein